MRDHVSDLFAEDYCFMSDADKCPFAIDDYVILHRPSPCQKCTSEFERGWR